MLSIRLVIIAANAIIYSHCLRTATFGTFNIPTCFLNAENADIQCMMTGRKSVL